MIRRQHSSGTKPQRLAIDGVLLLDKPGGLSSNQVLQRVKWLLKAQKAGHTGTLDPAATGLMVLCFGEATKLAGIGLEEDKTYEACVRLGIATDTGDAEGLVIKQSSANPSDAAVDAALASLRGAISQVPPMYSALKRDGKPLYDYARAGIELEREARTVNIGELTLERREAERLWIRVACSKGTYIRVLAEQIGLALGTCAHLETLRRTRIGTLEVTQATTIDALETMPVEARAALLSAPEILIKSVPSVTLGATEEGLVRRGQAIHRSGLGEGLRRMHADSGRLIGLAEARQGSLHPKRILLPPVAVQNLPSIA